MAFLNKTFLNLSLLLSAMFVVSPVMAVQAPNPRATGVASGNARRANATVTRDVAADSRTASGVSARSAGRVVSAPAQTVRARTATGTRGVTTARSAAPTVVRAATNSNAAPSVMTGRAASARATAVFNDISKIGGGYATCRDAYATCMDQFCANANDTYRRCYCSDRFMEFRDTMAALDEAKSLLLQFQDTNLNAVDKTAAEVEAMYSATIGEAAIRRDTSAAQKALNEISDLLNGKKAATTTGDTSGSLGILSFDMDDVDDIWSGGVDGLFSGSGSSSDISAKEGSALYTAANSQCVKLVDESCSTTAVLNMAKSAYGIMITQDCNVYERNVGNQKEKVAQTLREAEKILRDARLEEYRAHNSSDVNECVDRVRTAIQAEMACGANYKRCLDYTGQYIDPLTGDVHYSQALFKLTNQITLKDDLNVLDNNPNFNTFLDDKRKFATSALDTCRDLADTVWTEFKRTAIIEIAQAQAAKIEEVKMSCVSTIAECYDTQTKALKKWDNSRSQYTGSLVASAAASLCKDKLNACAALYADDPNTACVFNDDTKQITNATQCGMGALLNFVDGVDTIRIKEGCEDALANYAKSELCISSAGQSYPLGCRSLEKGDLETRMTTQANLYCQGLSDDDNDSITKKKVVTQFVEKLEQQMRAALMNECESRGGYWLNTGDAAAENIQNASMLTKFYSDLFGGRSGATQTQYGKCYVNDIQIRCQSYGSEYAKYNADRDECEFTDDWYKQRCTAMGGYYDAETCYLTEDAN